MDFNTVNKWLRLNSGLVFFYDLLMVVAAWILALLLRYNLSIYLIPQRQWKLIFYALPLLLFVQGIAFIFFRTYKTVWRYCSFADLMRILKAGFTAVLVVVLILSLTIRLQGFPRSLFPLYFILLVTLLGGSRFLIRYLKGERRTINKSAKRVLIVGAGQAAVWLVKDLFRHSSHFLPVVFVDDNKAKQNKEIENIPVKGTIDDIPLLIEEYNIDMIFIAIPSATKEEMMRMVNVCSKTGVKFQTLPSLSMLMSGKVSVDVLHDVSLDDLLGREEILIDYASINSEVLNKVVTVTGGGGSIGSELCRQISSLKPSKLIVIEKSEFNLYQLQKQLDEFHPDIPVQYYLADVTDQKLIEHIFQKEKPQIIFHAAAYKHVPILEDQVYAAVKNNILGMLVVGEAAIKCHADKFILISSDKAVRPSNVMGATKRAAEIIGQLLNEKNHTDFITVRFGNVIGSSGSVIPLFKDQLERGGPLTVTHPDVTRYFMTIPEAVRLILQASCFGLGGEIFVLDMGEPVKIQTLAEQLIRLSGKVPHRDIAIKHIGLRPGEKLYEELFYQHEEMMKTSCSKIFQAKMQVDIRSADDGLKTLKKQIETYQCDLLLSTLKQLVPEFKALC